MDDAIQDFVAALASERKSSQNTLGAYRTDLRQLIDFLRRRGIGSWEEVTPALIADFVLDLRERLYATTSIARKVTALKSFFHHLVATHVITHDPSEALQPPKVATYLPHALRPEEIERLFAAVSAASGVGQRDLAMLHTIYSTGMRVTELISLDVANVDLTHGHVRCVGRSRPDRILPLPLAAHSPLTPYIDTFLPLL